MAERIDVLYPLVCLAAWQDGDEYASVELVRALCSPNLVVRVITRAILRESRLETLLAPGLAKNSMAHASSERRCA